MQIVVTGATGFVGQVLVSRLLREGVNLRVLSRDLKKARRVFPDCELHHWPDVQLAPPAGALSGADAVIHLAGENVAGLWTRKKRARIRESRVGATRSLVEAIGSAAEPAPSLVSASAIGYYGDRGDVELTESSQPTEDFLSEVCQAWEGEALRAGEQGIRVTIARIGIVLGKGGGALAAMQTPFKLGAGGPLGTGRQWWSWIDVEDLVSLLFSAAQGRIEGVFNAVAPHPVRQADFARALGRQLRRPAFLPAPAPLLRAAVGGFSWELLSSKKVLPERILNTDFRFRSPRLEHALSRIYS